MRRNCVLATCVSPGRLDLEVVKHLRVEEREDDHLLQSCDVIRQTSDAAKAHLREADRKRRKTRRGKERQKDAAL